MKTYREILQEICGVICSYYELNKDSYEAYDTFECAIKKHNTDALELRLNVGGEHLAYKKIILQILADLRRARYIDQRCNESDAGYDSFYLQKISEIIRKNTDEFGEIIETWALDQNQYEKMCKDEGLI